VVILEEEGEEGTVLRRLSGPIIVRSKSDRIAVSLAGHNGEPINSPGCASLALAVVVYSSDGKLEHLSAHLIEKLVYPTSFVMLIYDKTERADSIDLLSWKAQSVEGKPRFLTFALRLTDDH
jgi:hypothetical protein